MTVFVYICICQKRIVYTHSYIQYASIWPCAVDYENRKMIRSLEEVIAVTLLLSTIYLVSRSHHVKHTQKYTYRW